MLLIRTAVLVTVLTFLWAILPFLDGHPWDIYCWKEWALYIHRNGLQNVYHSFTDYLPLYHYELWLYDMISGSDKAIEMSINTLRLFTIIFDAIGLWYVYKWTDRKVEFYILFILCILNVSYSYNTILWGQLDGILTTFIFMAIYYAYQKKVVLSSILIVLALNFKLQAIVFVPIWGLLMINGLLVKRNISVIISSFVAIIGLEILILLPFMLNGALADVWRVATGSVDKFPFLTMGAKNVWTWIFNGNTAWVPDSGVWFMGITYKQAGLFMFFTASLIVLLPVVVRLIKRFHKPEENIKLLTKEQLWLTCALISMLFYFLNTQMHERYIHPAFIFILVYAITAKDFFPLALFAVAYLLNLEDELGALHLRDKSTLLLDDIFISILYAIEIVYLSVKLFILYRWKHRSSDGKDMAPLIMMPQPYLFS
jgi:Gpi18-like mannosyltransferase